MILVCNPHHVPFATSLGSRTPPQPELLLVAKLAYALAPDGTLERLPLGKASVSGDVFAPDAEDERGEVFVPSDFAHTKLDPEVMLRGSCHTPKGRPMRECGVSLTVGAWSKRLRIVGDRHHVPDALGGSFTEPLPFTSMPLTWARSFGGPDVAENPVGLGHARSERLPNVEYPDDPVTRRGGKHRPAGFGPVSPLWPVRLAKMGKKYDDTWKATRAPFVSEDFDWSYHQSAPRDQWLSTLRGDERVVLENLLPERSLLEFRLPGERVVAYARRKGRSVEPIAVWLDTLFIDLEQKLVSLTFRGHMRVRELDLSDVHSVLLEVAQSGAKRRPLTDVTRDLEAFEADPAGLSAVKQEIEARFRAIEKDLPEPPAAPQGGSDPITSKLDGVFDEGSIVRRHVRAQMANALSGPNGQKLAEALAKHESEADVPPPTRGRPGVAPSTRLRSQMRPVAEKIALLKNKPDLARAQLEEVLADDPHAPAFQRKRDRVWVGKAKRLLRPIK